MTVDNKKQSKELEALAKRIRSARKEARLSQKSLATVIGVSDKSVSAYEQGRSIPPFEKLKKIASCTNRPLTYFTEDSTDESTIMSKLQTIEQEIDKIKKLLENSHK